VGQARPSPSKAIKVEAPDWSESPWLRWKPLTSVRGASPSAAAKERHRTRPVPNPRPRGHIRLFSSGHGFNRAVIRAKSTRLQPLRAPHVRVIASCGGALQPRPSPSKSIKVKFPHRGGSPWLQSAERRLQAPRKNAIANTGFSHGPRRSVNDAPKALW